MLQYGLVTYTMIFFTCKNALIIALQTYRYTHAFNSTILLNTAFNAGKPRFHIILSIKRELYFRAFVLLNDRYIHPKPPALDILEPHHMHHIREHPRKPTGTKKSRKRKTKRVKNEERQHLFSPKRERRKKNHRRMDTLQETIA